MVLCIGEVSERSASARTHAHTHLPCVKDALNGGGREHEQHRAELGVINNAIFILVHRCHHRVERLVCVMYVLACESSI